MDRLRATRVRFGLNGKVQIHHIIPKTHARLSQLPRDDAANLILMPTHLGMRTMRLRPNRLVHDGGHLAYNDYCKKLLEAIEKGEDYEVAARAIRAMLRERIRADDPTLPWEK